MNKLLLLFIGVTAAMNIDILENELDAMIEKDPKFGEWYFSKEKNMLLPHDAYEKYHKLLDDISKHVTSEAFRLKMVMRKHGWNDEYLEMEMARIRESVNSQKRRPYITPGFGDNDYVKYFNGITDYSEARAVVLRYKELCEAIPSDLLLNK